jgi:hypothetical protein
VLLDCAAELLGPIHVGCSPGAALKGRDCLGVFMFADMDHAKGVQNGRISGIQLQRMLC